MEIVYIIYTMYVVEVAIVLCTSTIRVLFKHYDKMIGNSKATTFGGSLFIVLVLGPF